MKRIVALTLALLLLLSALSALAESNVGTLRLSGLSLSHVDGGKTRSVKFRKISMSFAFGIPEGVPTLQATFDNGEGQAVDAVAQIEESSVLLSMGGISGVYTFDLSDYIPGGNSANLIASGIGSVLTLATTHLDTLLRTVTTDEGGHNRSMEMGISTGFMTRAMGALLALCEGMEATEDVDLGELRERVENVGDEARLSFRYNESTGAFEVAILHANQGMRLSGVMEVGSEVATLASISPEETRYDLANLAPDVLEQLKGELNFIVMKFVHFADGSGLDNLF